MINDETALAKQKIRREVASAKRNFSAETLLGFSRQIASRLERSDAFRNAHAVLFYFALPDEVGTRELIEKYIGAKRIVLPVVHKNGLLLRELTEVGDAEKSSFGIFEPRRGEYVDDYSEIDLVVIPGVAFDRNLHRLGRGKGYYDRLLPAISAPKIGLCFDFQLYDAVPFDERDIPVDMVISQKETLGDSKKNIV